MARVLITGSTGFVGARLYRRLAQRGADAVVGLARGAARGAQASIDHLALDLADPACVETLRRFPIERIYHLAALAHPGDCEANPDLARRVQIEGTRHLCRAFAGSGARLLFVSTSQVYGPGGGAPISELDEPRPRSVYGRSKLAAEELALAAGGHGLEVIVARPFNHSGAGQTPRYVLPAFWAEILRAKLRGDVARTGNLYPERDFLHVEDVLDAYELLMERGVAGEVYNVCRGEAVAVGELLAGLQRRLDAPLRAEPDTARVLEGDPSRIVGDNTKLRALGWSPHLSIEELLDDVARGTAPPWEL